MRVLVTGAAGFVGFHVTRRLLERGDEVVGLDNLTSYYDVALKEARLQELSRHRRASAFRFVRCDLADAAALGAALDGEPFDAVCHLAAQVGVRYSLTDPQAYVASNLHGFVNLLEHVRHAEPRPGHFVFASSSSVYGGSRAMPYRVSDRVDRPVSLYGATKRANELMAHSYSHLFGLPATGLRFFTVYGPWGRPDMAYWTFTRLILAGETIRVFNRGEMKRDFTFVGDIVEGIVRVLEGPPSPGDDGAPPFRLYNIGRGEPVPLMAFIAAIEAAVGREAVIELAPMQPGDMVVTWADTSALERDHGYRPTTSLAEGVAAFVAWYREYHAS